MEIEEDLAISGRVLVEPVEFVDLREIAKGKHGSHRASPERDLPIKLKKTGKDLPSHQDHSYNCVQIARQDGAPHGQDSNDVFEEPCPEQGVVIARTPSKDEVLSVVIQKLTELVKNSEKQRKGARDQHALEDNDGKGQGLPPDKRGGKTRLYQCPNCPCLFTGKKGQLCSCCAQDSRSTSPTDASDADELAASCFRDGQDHKGIACDLCSMKVQSYTDLLYHLATHDANIYRCKVCNFVTTRQTTIENHQELHMTEVSKKCVCNICGYQAQEFSKLQVHIRKEHHTVKEILLKCSECGYSTKTEAALRNHMWNHIEADDHLQSSDTTAVIEKSKSNANSDTGKTAKSVQNGGEQPKRLQSPEVLETNTKMFKCLLCGYLCEKLSTLKAHAWRHAGQEGCSYPVMHRLEDISKVASLEHSARRGSGSEKENEFSSVAAANEKETVVGAEYTVTKSSATKTSKETKGCHCSPIVLPKEEHDIVQKVFDEATTKEPDEESTVSSTTATSELKASQLSSSESSIQKIATQIDAVAEVVKEVILTSSSPDLKNVDTSDCGESMATPPAAYDVSVVIHCSELAAEEVVTSTDESTDTSANVLSVAEQEHLQCEELDQHQLKESTDMEHDNQPVKKKCCRNPKRKLSSCSSNQEKKKLCGQPGISKMLLNAVDSALQIRAENEKKSPRSPHPEQTMHNSDTQDKYVKVITASSSQNSEDSYQCPICKKMFASTVETHVCSQGATPIFKCHRCPATFWHPGRLQYHMATHEAILKCSKCPFRCSSEVGLRDHVKKAHLPAKSSMCPTCHSEIVDQSPKAHEQSCILKCFFGCRECDFAAGSVEELKSHVQASHQKPYKCGMCDYSSATANGIKNHMKFHNADKPYKCPLCDFSGAYPQSLRSHMKKHSASSPGQSNDQYKCEFCSYTSSHLPSMKSHMWRHTSHPGYDYDRQQDIIKTVASIPKEKESGGKATDTPLEATPETQSCELSRIEEDSPREGLVRSKGSPKRDSTVSLGAPKEPPKSKKIQYGSVIFQCSQCGFKSNDHGCLVDHLRGHLENGGGEKAI